MEYNNIITLYKRQTTGLKFLFAAIITTVILLLKIIFCQKDLMPAVIIGNIVINTLFFLLSIILYIAFYKENEKNKNLLFIKENGTSYRGQVLHIEERIKDDKKYRDLLIEFFNGKENKLIVFKNFPYNIEAVNVTMFLKYMEFINKKGGDKFKKIEEIKKVYEEKFIYHTQYYGNGYISFEKTNLTNKICEYNAPKNKNYEGDLTCSVYEYEGKYVIDDFEGYPEEEIRKRNKKIIKKIIICVVVTLIYIIYAYDAGIFK